MMYGNDSYDGYGYGYGYDGQGEAAPSDAELDRQTMERAREMAADEAAAAGDWRAAADANEGAAKDLRRAAEGLGGLADRLLGAVAERTVHAPASEVAVGRSAEGADRDGHGGRYALRAAGRAYDADAYDALYAAALEARQAVEWHLLAQQYAHDMALLAQLEGNEALMRAEAEARAGMARPSDADWEGIAGRMDEALGAD